MMPLYWNSSTAERKMEVLSQPLRKAPGEGLEPSSPEGHQLARHIFFLTLHLCDLEADPF